MILFSLGLIGVSLSDPNIGHLAAACFTLSGLIYYFPFVYFNVQFEFLSNYFRIFEFHIE